MSSRYLASIAGKHAGVDVRRQRQVAVGPDLPVIGQGELEALPRRQAEVGNKPARRALGSARDVEDGQERKGDAEELQTAALEADAFLVRDRRSPVPR